MRNTLIAVHMAFHLRKQHFFATASFHVSIGWNHTYRSSISSDAIQIIFPASNLQVIDIWCQKGTRLKAIIPFKLNILPFYSDDY